MSAKKITPDFERNNMRLTLEQTQSIVATVTRWAGEDATVFLFGSRLDDKVRGGDVDLLVETDAPLALIERARIKMHLEKGLGLPVDVVSLCRKEKPTPFQQIARTHAMQLVAQQ